MMVKDYAKEHNLKYRAISVPIQEYTELPNSLLFRYAIRYMICEDGMGNWCYQLYNKSFIASSMQYCTNGYPLEDELLKNKADGYQILESDLEINKYLMALELLK